MRGFLMMMLLAPSLALCSAVFAATIDPPSVNWPAGWQISYPPPPQEALEEELQSGQTRATYYQNGKPVAAMQILYAQGGRAKPLDEELKASLAYAGALAKKSGMDMKFDPAFVTKIGTLQALAAEGTLTRGDGVGAKEWIGVAFSGDQIYGFYYSARADNYAKYKQDMEKALGSFRPPVVRGIDVEKTIGEYAFYIFIAGLVMTLIWLKARKKKAVKVPPSFPKAGL